jgi:hypothetical protein
MLEYFLLSRRPPRLRASRCMYLRSYFLCALCAQVGHHVPLRIAFGVVSHLCPSAQRHLSRPYAPRYPVDKHLPLRRFANTCISAIVGCFLNFFLDITSPSCASSFGVSVGSGEAVNVALLERYY